MVITLSGSFMLLIRVINVLFSLKVTDSPYVVASMGIMTRMGTPVLKKLAEGAEFVRCQHSVGRPLPLKGANYYPTPVLSIHLPSCHLQLCPYFLPSLHHHPYSITPTLTLCPSHLSVRLLSSSSGQLVAL